MSNGNDLKRTRAHISQMCDYVFNEEEMKKREGKKQEKEDEKRKSASIFLIAK